MDKLLRRLSLTAALLVTFAAVATATPTPTPTATKTPTPTPTPNLTTATVLDYGAVCDGTTDDSLAIQRAIGTQMLAGYPARFPSGRTCRYDSTVTTSLEASTDLEAEAHRNAVIRLTGSCTSSLDCTTAGDMYESNAAVTVQWDNIKITGITFQMERTGCGCVLAAFKNKGDPFLDVQTGPFLHDVNITTDNQGNVAGYNGIPVASDNPLAAVFRSGYMSEMSDSVITGNFKQGVVFYAYGTQQPRLNGLKIFTNSNSATVFNDSLYQIEDRQSNNLSMVDTDIFGGPNGIWLNATAGNAVTGTGLRGLSAHQLPQCAPWLPNHAYDGVTHWNDAARGSTAGMCVVPSQVGTFSATSGAYTMTSSVALTTLYPGDWITIAGLVSPPTFTTQVTAVNGTTVSTMYAANQTFSGRGGYWSNYSGHIYRATTAGTSFNGPQPIWSSYTTHNAHPPTDGTVTWTEYGEGASILDEGQATDVVGGQYSISSGPTLYIRTKAVNGVSGTATVVQGADMSSGLQTQAIRCESCAGLVLRGNTIRGQGALLRTVDGAIHPTGLMLLGNTAVGNAYEQVFADSNSKGIVNDSRITGNVAQFLVGPGTAGWLNQD